MAVTVKDLSDKIAATGGKNVKDPVAVAQLALYACRADHGDALTATIGAVLLLVAESDDADELIGVAIRSLELGRASIARIRAQDQAVAAEIAARRARDAS